MRQGATLTEMRRKRQVSQEKVANKMLVPQANISRIENGDGVYLSTLISYIQALGDKLEIVAVFPDERYLLDDHSGAIKVSTSA